MASKIVCVCLVLFLIIIPNIVILKAGTDISVSVGNIYLKHLNTERCIKVIKTLITFDIVVFSLRIYLRENQHMQRFMPNRAFIQKS